MSRWQKQKRAMTISSITAIIPVRFQKAPGLAGILDVIMPYGYHPAECGGDIYLDEHDGTRFLSLWPAVQSLFPKGTQAHSNTVNEAWISGFDVEQFDGMTVSIKYTQTDEDGEFSESAELINQ
jgi:hypothetical protein